MKIKIILSSLAFILCFGGLCVTAFLAKIKVKENLLMILPSQIDSPRINAQKIEDFSQDEFLITYENKISEKVNLPQGNFPVTLIGTNDFYSQILGLKMMEGSFFSKQAWTGKQRHAVLNEKAAFEIFGSSRVAGNRFRIGGDTWLVTGVVKDGDDKHSRVYVPSSIQGAPASEFLTLMSRDYDELNIKNRIKTLEIRESNFTFINLGTQIRLLWERVVIIPLIFFALLFIGLLPFFIGKFANALAALKKELNRHYTNEIFSKKRNAAIKPAAFALIVLSLPTAALFLFLRIVSIVLRWKDIPSINKLNRDLFYPHLARLYNFDIASLFFFGFTLFFLAILIVFVLIPVNAKKTP